MTTENRGLSYKDPMYDEVEAGLEQELNLPQGGISAIRTRGERSNADQVSPVGARTVYQIMPSTRKLFLDKYGVDAYESPEAAARVAALHLRESMDRNGGDWAEAVGEYHGGTNRRNWGPINEAYRARVLGGSVGAPARDPQRPLPSAEELLGMPTQAAPETPSEEPQTAQQRFAGMLETSDEQNAIGVEQIAGMEAAAIAQEERNESFTVSDRFAAAVDETWFVHRVADMLDRTTGEVDAAFQQDYRNNYKQIERGFSPWEVSLMREASNHDELQVIQQQIEERRENQEQIASAATPLGLQIGTGLLDPSAWFAGGLVGQGFKTAGLGSVALRQAGRPGASIAAAGAEGIVGDVGLTAALHMSGENIQPLDYGIATVTGGFIGAGLGWAGNRFAGDDIEAAAMLERRNALVAEKAQFTEAARTQLGERATVEEVAEQAQALEQQSYLDMLKYALADIPENQKLGSSEPLEIGPELLARVNQTGDVEGIRVEAERQMVEDAIARALLITDDIDVDTEALQTILAKVGMESPAGRLLQSESPVYRAVGMLLLENAQGAAGRRRSAAVTQHIRENAYNKVMSNYDALSRQYSASIGIGPVRNAVNGEGNNAFNRAVMMEIEQRNGSAAGTRFSDNPYVNEAADNVETGMTMMRHEQQTVNVIGAERLGTTPDASRGHITHKLSPEAVLNLPAAAAKRVRAVFSRQFQQIEGFDKEFADDLAKDYVNRGRLKAHGHHAVPVDVSSPEASEIIRDVLKGKGIEGAELEDLMGKFARGGASHTKKRLKLDLTEDIGDGKQLIDLFVTDVPQLYRSYARRVSGDVALAQYGVMGQPGLDVLKRAGMQSGATPAETDAFDQIISEFLNTPYGKGRNSVVLDNVRAATSAARLGGMVFTQQAEWANVIPVLGIRGMLNGIAAMPRMAREIRELVKTGKTDNAILRDWDQMGGGMGMDDYHNTRMFDVKDNEVEAFNGSSSGLLTRMIRGASHANMVLSGQRLTMAVQTRGLSEGILKKAFRYVAEGSNTTALDDMGIDATLRKAIAEDMDRVATFDNKGKLVALNMREGKALTPQLVNQMHQAIERGSAQMIQRTFIGETGAWAHDSLLKSFFQFRTFGLTSVEKQWGRNKKNYGTAKAVSIVVGAASIAMPIYMARVGLNAMSKAEDEREEYLDRNLTPLALTRATLNYVSSAGLAGDAADLMALAATGILGDDTLEEVGLGDVTGRMGQNAGTLQGFVPGFGLVNDAAKLDPSALPGGNLPYVRPVRDGIEQLFDD